MERKCIFPFREAINGLKPGKLFVQFLEVQIDIHFPVQPGQVIMDNLLGEIKVRGDYPVDYSHFHRKPQPLKSISLIIKINNIFAKQLL